MDQALVFDESLYMGCHHNERCGIELLIVVVRHMLNLDPGVEMPAGTADVGSHDGDSSCCVLENYGWSSQLINLVNVSNLSDGRGGGRMLNSIARFRVMPVAWVSKQKLLRYTA
jgi:hypothetical protein